MIRPLPIAPPAAATSAPSSSANAAGDVMARLDALEQEFEEQESRLDGLDQEWEEVKMARSPGVDMEVQTEDMEVQQSAPQPAEVQQSAPQPAADDVILDEEARQESSPDVAVEQEVQDTEVQQSATQPAQACSISTGCSSARPCI